MTIATLTALFFCSGIAALTADDGALDQDFAKNLRKSVKLEGAERALYNALTRNDAKNLAVNREIVKEHNNIFNHKVNAKGITDQNRSGRCWLYAATNIMRPEVIEKHKLDNFEFSLCYLAFWDKLEKANFFLETVIELRDRELLDRELDYFMRDPINDGGWWRYAVALIDKYGVVPKEVMPETFSSGNTTVMNDVLETMLHVDAAKLRKMAEEKKSVEEMRQTKRKMIRDVYRVLVMSYGEPAEEFTYRYVDKDKKVSEPKSYTPQSFYKEWVGVDLSQYVNLCNDPTNPYGKQYRMRRVRNVVGAPDVFYVNVPIDVLKSVALKSVIDGQATKFSADAMKDMDRDKGIMQVGLYDYATLYGVDLTLGKADRLRTRDGAANHAMVFIGVDTKDDKPVKWLVENSWGKSHGDGGCWTMYDKWFDEHVYSIIVKKAYVPNDVLKVFQDEPVELPPWAPMNSFFE
ncbi:MAG: C1 family peptidase [Pirellulales bacterium]|nr:C1 family peptidase [Pirellulales bacterium]